MSSRNFENDLSAEATVAGIVANIRSKVVIMGKLENEVFLLISCRTEIADVGKLSLF